MLKRDIAFPPQQKARVWETQEKGSDVNLATYLLLDAFRDDFDLALVITYDTDLIEPIRVVRKVFGKTVGVVNPHILPKPMNNLKLSSEADFYRVLKRSALARCQFPDTLVDAHGTFSKPRAWS